MASKAMNIVVVGGAGHVGLPLSVELAYAGANVEICDGNAPAVDMVNTGHMPFLEPGIGDHLRQVIGRTLTATTSLKCIFHADVIIVTIGTPVDEHLNPDMQPLLQFVNSAKPYLVAGQTMILRSTLYPGTSARINDMLPDIHVAVCPERIAEGKALEELHSLPQIVAAYSDKGMQAAFKTFALLQPDVVLMDPLEAELGKLFANSWRYLQFAAANQFYMLAESAGASFYEIHDAITYDYPRLATFPKAGLTAGPCLLKDTIMLAAFAKNNYFLGHAAMLVNEGLPQFLVDQLKAKIDISHATVGILGMTFKGNSDDTRSSLSFKLKKILEREAGRVICTDEYAKGEGWTTFEIAVAKSDALILAAPHSRYREIDPSRLDKPIIDVWNLLGE